MNKIDCVWLGAAILTYDTYKEKGANALEDFYFSQQDIINAAKAIIQEKIPNAMVSQHACAYSTGPNAKTNYLVVDGKRRRLSYTGEFGGNHERPDFSEIKGKIKVSTLHGEVELEELFAFVDQIYTSHVKEKLEEHFSSYDLGSVLDYIREYEGKDFIAVEKAGNQALEMETYKKLGSARRKCVLDFASEVKRCMPRYEKVDISGWINQGQRTTGYIWSQLRKKTKEEYPTSMSIIFEKMGIDATYELRISVEAQDSKCVKDEYSSAEDKYYRHARLLNVEKRPGLDYYIGGSLSELFIPDMTVEEIKNYIESNKNKKVQICKALPESNLRSMSSYEVFRFMVDAVYELEPYYDAAVAEEKEREWWPSLSEYNPGISADKYEEILSNENMVKRELLDTILGLYNMGGSGTCKQIAEKYGNVSGHYNSNARAVAAIVQEVTGCQLYQNEIERKAYWPVLFFGREADKQEPGVFEWKLREPLAAAIKSMIEKGIIDMGEIRYKHLKNGGIVRTSSIRHLKKGADVSFDCNMILYGPPGTGKTYNTVIYAVAICNGKAVNEVEARNYEEVKNEYDELKKAGRIAFTTFHQSYGYEEFIEGIRPVMPTGEDTDIVGAQLKYRVYPGIFKEFCDKAKRAEVKTDKFDIAEDAAIWKATIRAEVRNDCFEKGRVRIDWGIDSEGAKGFVNDMKKGDIILATDGSRSSINGIAVVTSEKAYELGVDGDSDRTTRDVTWLASDIDEDVTGINGGKWLHRMTCARVPKMAVEDIVTLAVRKNANLAGTEIKKNEAPYVLIIDEINRGNISKIFGELITLIEGTKRLGMPEQASAILPYSKDEFSVPANVYILGTMNTADRSIALMDTALRRRFSFIEMMPESKLLNDIAVEKNGMSVNIGEMLKVINERIEFLFDREHTIGHAFFMKLKDNPSIDVLADIFKRSVVPLLQEYFYEDYEKIQLVLGDNGKAEDKYKFIKNDVIIPSGLFRGHTRLEKSDKYIINKSAFNQIESYVGILNPVEENDDEE